MSDEPREGDLGSEEPDPTPPPGGPETGESGGFGLTDEFNRIEAEIQEEMTAAEGAAEQPADGPAQDPPPAAEVPEGNDTLGTPPETSPTDGSTQDESTETETDAEAADSGADAEPAATLEGESAPAEVDGVAGDSEPAALEVGAEESSQRSPTPSEEGSSAAAQGEPDHEEPPDQPTEVSAALPEESATEHPVITPMPRPTPISVAATIPDEELEENTPRLWLSFLVGSLLIILSMATATTAFGLIFFTELAEKLSDNQIKGVDRILAASEGGEAQTILLIGSDKRSTKPEEGARSDTTMLLRVDPDNKTLALFSLPRDLVVEIPGYGTDRLNAAFSIGNAKLTLKTVQKLTGLQINHLVRIDFEGFGSAVNAIDCVYIDVDRDYENTTDASYAAIDINPGYQRLCGQDALDYVRYRHTDTDIVRAARQQDFLREARQKVPTRELLSPLGDNELIDIFTEYTESDIDSAQEIIGILKSFLGVVDAPVTEVHFEGDIGDATNTEVTATRKEIQSSVDQLLGNAGTSGPRGGDNALIKPESGKDKDDDKDKQEGGGDGGEDQPAEIPTEATVIAADPGFGRFALTVERRRENLSAFYPSVMVPSSSYNSVSREYDICVDGPVEGDCRATEDAYKLVITLERSTALPEYYGVMGTTWDDPPILRSPSEVREIDGREYLLFYDGDRLRMVGFRFEGASYWVNNTLTQAIDEPDMLEIATTMKQAHLKEAK